ncbi:hypothetical protein H0H92_007335 [Tricholoma furcatifolium]|nr:hypothetical protein H0H92_007335 [Tricholoma furcatifolium]
MPFSFLVASLLLTGVRGAVYNLADSHQGTGFLKSFSYQAIPDPTNGRVNYVDAATAASQNLTYASGDHFVLRADYTQVLSASGPGRNSVRLMSNKQYSTSATMTWPALWTVGADWPNEGEIDILEGVNDEGPNQATLHTGSGEKIATTLLENNCDADVNNNAGCGVQFSDPRSYGPTFNDNGGGWIAMERTSTEVKIWFWSRTATNVPSDVANGGSSIDTTNWAVIGLELLTQNLAALLHVSANYVNNNPSAFVDAYFDFQWLKIYE